MSRAGRQAPRTKRDRALEELYARIPQIPDCSGKCAVACGPIAMFKGEWDRMRPRLSSTKLKNGIAGHITCPALSPTGACTVYSVRPFICRLWGTTPALACPEGCVPERWISREEAHELFEELSQIAGPQVSGTMGRIEDLWAGFALEQREQRIALVEKIRKVVSDAGDTGQA